MTISSDASGSLAGRMVRVIGSALPTSFNGDGELFALNLFLMTAFMCLGALMAGRMAHALWRHRREDHLRHPVTVWRVAWLLRGLLRFCAAAQKP